ncbi:DUF3825 domain-containing protein [Paraburkholderia sediminicola]|uniref:DUF3825 domain-containing protein n=1 Tax=Paraburkholderia sediminicola TaxID=458836 RepID=UPI0038BD8B64
MSLAGFRSLFRLYKQQPVNEVFAHFYPLNADFDAPFTSLAGITIDGLQSWGFVQKRFSDRHPHTSVPKLKNYLNYTFVRLVDLEQQEPGKYFKYSPDGTWLSFNTGLQTQHGNDILATFQKYQPKAGAAAKDRPQWVYKGTRTPSETAYRQVFAHAVPELAWYSRDSNDFVFNTSYTLDRDVFDHVFERAKERAGLPNASDEVVKNYLRGAIENLVPKIKRNYKVAIPVYFVEEKKMQLLLPFESASSSSDVSCFLVERDDQLQTYRLKTIFDMDQAFYSARLITRPDRDWLNP